MKVAILAIIMAFLASGGLTFTQFNKLVHGPSSVDMSGGSDDRRFQFL
jgi:hypothetical protein